MIASKKGENKRDFSKRCDQLDEKAAGDIALIALDDLFYLWLKKYVAVKRSNAYYDSMIGVYEAHIKNSFGKKKIEDIKRSDAYKLLTTVEKEGASASLVSKTRICISAPYNWAINSLAMKITSPTTGLIYKVEIKKHKGPTGR